MSQTKPFFIPQKEFDLINVMNEELIDEIVGQSVDIYKVNTGPSYVERSVERGFKTGYIFYVSIIGLQILRTKSFSPILKPYLPSFNINKQSGKGYFPMITSFSIITLGWIGYDWYMDRRSNYFTPKDEQTLFPKRMFVFSFNEWAYKKGEP